MPHRQHIQEGSSQAHNQSGSRQPSLRGKAAVGLAIGAAALFAGNALSDDQPSDNNRYPNPPAEDTLRLQHIVEPGDGISNITQDLAEQFKENTPGMETHLDPAEIADHRYDVPGGTTPDGYPIPKNDPMPHPNEHIVFDIPHKDVFDK